jgi:hypothetical protein
VIDKLLKKARQSLTTARLDLEAGDTDASVNRSYYAAFYAAWAMFEASRGQAQKAQRDDFRVWSPIRERRPVGPVLGCNTSAAGESAGFRGLHTLEETPAEKAKAALVSAEKFVT